MASMLRKLIPLGDRILVKRVEPIAQTVGGVFLPESNLKKMNEGEVVAVGVGARNKDGEIIPVTCAVGDKVLLPEYGGHLVKLGEDELHLFRDEDILGKFSN